MSLPTHGPLLTLEPLIEAVRQGVEAGGWELSGLQKTTSHEFAGRWEGESTRSAYLFFHHEEQDDAVSVEGYLDETSAGLQANLSLVIDARPLGEIGEIGAALRTLGLACSDEMGSRHTAAVSLRARLADPRADPARAGVELRFRSRIPASVTREGAGSAVAFVGDLVRAFERLARRPDIRRITRAR